MSTTVNVSLVKCACSDCVCVIDAKRGIQKDGHYYCSAECAEHHKNGVGCHHAGCSCHG